MCLYPRMIYNPKYKANKKNGGQLPPVTDNRVIYVPIKCNKCIECKKQIAREWQARLLEDIRHNKNGKFITLTFTNEWIKKIIEGYKNENGQWVEGIDAQPGYARDNAIATKATRHFLERWRKEYKKSLRHWLITEIGHNGTENIHLHGIVWTDKDIENVARIWKYGYVWTGKKEEGRVVNYVNERTIGYITKYVTKVDEKHTTYQSIILTSAGIGAGYMKRGDVKKNEYKEGQTKEYYRTRTGHKISLPIYWRNKIYTDQEKEQLWIEKLNKEERWVMGERIDISKGEEGYEKLVEYYRKINARLGYGTGIENYDKAQYEKQRRTIMQETRIQKAKKVPPAGLLTDIGKTGATTIMPNNKIRGSNTTE